MQLIQVQMALFSQQTIVRPDLIFNEVNQKLGGIIDTMPNIINLSMDVPGDFPIVSSTSSNGKYSINVSRARVDFFIRPEFEKKISPTESLKEYQSFISKYYRTVAGTMAVSRVGVIFTLFEFVENNVKAVFEKHFKRDYSTAYSEASLKLNRQGLVKGIAMNNITNIDASTLHHADKDYPGVVFLLDINNVPLNEKNLSMDEIAEIFKHATMKVKSNELKELI